MASPPRRFEWKDDAGATRGWLRIDKDHNGLPTLRVEVAGLSGIAADPDHSGIVVHREFFEMITELCFVQLAGESFQLAAEGRGQVFEQLAHVRRRRIEPPPEPHQEIFARLHCACDTAQFHISWQVQRPFRPIDLLLFGATHQTWLHSLRVCGKEQVSKPFPFLHVMHAPNYPLSELLGNLEQEPPGNHFEHGVLRSKVQLTNENPELRCITAAPGQILELGLSGPIEHVAILGLSLR
jgi:hypothetical protein